MDFPEILQTRRTLRYANLQTLLLALLTGVLFLFATSTWLNYSIENIKAQQRSHLSQYVTLARSTIKPVLQQLQAGQLSQKEALIEVRDTVRRMTYVDEYGPNYIFMSSYDGVMLVQPYEPQKELSNMWDLQDTNGVYIIRGLVQVAQENPEGGFFTYYYYPPNSKVTEEKLSFVFGIPELNAYIGTGTYMGKFYTQQENLFTQVRWLLLFALVLTGGAALLTIHRLNSNSNLLVREIEERRKAQAAIELSDKNLQVVFDSIYDAIFLHDYQGKILMVNQRMLQMYGIDQVKALRLAVMDVSAPQEVQKYRLEDVWERVQGGEEVLFEWKCLRLLDGSFLDCEVALRPVTWYGHEAVLAVVRDISDRKQAERERQKNQQVLEHSQELAHVGSYFSDLESHTLIWSKELYRIYGLDLSTLPPSQEEHRLMMLPGDWERVNNVQMEAHRAGEIASVEYGIHRPDGSIRYLNLVMDWGRDADGKIATHTGTIQDITEQREHEEVLRSSEEKFRLVVEQMSEGFSLVDEEGTVIAWNHAQEEISGLQRELAIGRKVWDIQIEFMSIEDRTEEFRRSLKEHILQMLRDVSSPFFAPEGIVTTLQHEKTLKFVTQTSFPVITSSGYRVGSLLRDVTDLMRSQEQVQHELHKLNALHEIDTRIVNQDSLNDILESVAEQARNLLKVDAVTFLSFEPETKHMRTVASFGFKEDVSDHPHLFLQTCLPWQTIIKGGLLCLKEAEGCLSCEGFNNEGFKAAYSYPITANRQVKGVFELFSYAPLQVDKEWEDFFEILAGQTAVAMEKTGLFRDLQVSNIELNQAYEATISGWSRALELRDKETKGHSERVMQLAFELALQLNYPAEDIQHFRRGVLLHDIGKMGVPDSILLKPGPLNEEEWQIMRMHPEYAYRLLADIDYLRPSLDIPYCHHERWDGSGYPRGLKGEEIPLSARIFAVVDVWDALINDRPYRSAWTTEAVRQYLLENAGTTLDPNVVKEFLTLV